jgi:hypothetical protein
MRDFKKMRRNRFGALFTTSPGCVGGLKRVCPAV